ncbi:MAG: hypothetical protein H7Y38_19285 [Armatimonadetes bacterium]|nr:hypothetical protein [Armatimonadota bacterium]
MNPYRDSGLLFTKKCRRYLRNAVEASLATEPTGERERAALSRDAGLADEYLTDLVYCALLERGGASKVSEIALEINNARVSVALVRRALGDAKRFLTIDRQWNLQSRYLDKGRPTDRNLIEIIKAAGRPLSKAQIASELSEIYRKPSESYFGSIDRTATNRTAYFRTPHGEVGLATWLTLADGETEEDILSDNGYKAGTVAKFRKLPAQAKWSANTYAQTTFEIVSAAKRDLPHRFIGVLAWLAMGAKYDPQAHFAACFADPSLVWMPAHADAPGRWITRKHADILERLLEEEGATLSQEGYDEPEPVAVPVVEPVAAATEETTPEPVAAPVAPVAVVVDAPPLSVTDADLAAMVQVITERNAGVEASELLALRYEVLPGDPSYRADVETLTQTLKGSDSFLYVGVGRFRLPDSLPLFVYDIPDFLSFPELQFVSMDGEIMDEVISDEGYAASLRQDIMLPLAQDAGDDEGAYTGAPLEAGTPLRLVVKNHHKDIGTFPLCQIPDGFFPTDAPVVEVIIRAPDGATHEVVINNEKRLAFNLFGLYELLPFDSGSVFLLHPTGRAWEFRFEPVAEADPQVFVSPERQAELLGLKEAIDEGAEMATFDITCEVLAYHQKGLDFVEAMTEINIVRRVTRRKLASILSNYLCFLQKAGTPQWRFDPRKRDSGTDRDKRKYLKR